MLRMLPMPTNQMMSPRIIAAVDLETILFSSKYATLGSSKEIALLKAAMDNNIKNAGPIIFPKGISIKIVNRLLNTRPVPCCGSIP